MSVTLLTPTVQHVSILKAQRAIGGVQTFTVISYIHVQEGFGYRSWRKLHPCLSLPAKAQTGQCLYQRSLLPKCVHLSSMLICPPVRQGRRLVETPCSELIQQTYLLSLSETYQKDEVINLVILGLSRALNL